MKASALLPWILAGGLAASTVWNLQLLRRIEDVEARLAEPTPTLPKIPGRVVAALGLTDQQCEMIRGCSMN